MAKLTAWIKCKDQQPTIPGWYDVWFDTDREIATSRRYWDGRFWYLSNGPRSMFGDNTSDKWRGLASKPEGQP